jgi:hypothetical protein
MGGGKGYAFVCQRAQERNFSIDSVSVVELDWVPKKDPRKGLKKGVSKFLRHSSAGVKPGGS